MIITLTGENSYVLKAELDKLVSDFVGEFTDMALERVDAEEADYQRIYDTLTGLPFLSNKKIVVLKSPSANKEFVEKFESLLNGLPDTTDLIVFEPKLDKRTALYKYLKKATDFREFNNLDMHGLSAWLVEQAKSKGGSLNLTDGRFLVERAGMNQQLLANELDKLLLYDAKVSRGSIELLTEPTPQSTIFELLDAAFAGDTKKAMKLYEEQRALKVEPQQIIAMLAWQLHVLALIKTASEKTSDQIAKEAKLNPFVVRKSSGIAKQLSYTELKKMISNLLAIDVRLKTETIDADEALQHYLMMIANN